MVFHRVRQSLILNFTFGGNQLEMIHEYNCLGKLFGRSGTFSLACSKWVTAAETAVGLYLHVPRASKLKSWRYEQILFQSLMLNVLVHAIGICGLRYCEQVEVIHQSCS